MAKKKKSTFRGKVTKNAERQKQAESSYGYLMLPRELTLFKEEAGGRINLDFIPYVVEDERHPDRDADAAIAVPGELWYRRPFKVHRNVGAANDSLVCPTSIGKRCPICEYRAKRAKEGAEKEELDTMKASLRNLYLVIPKDSKKHEEKIHLWDISQYLFQNLLNDELEEDSDYEVFPDLEEGLTLKIRFEEKQIGKNKFANTSRIDFVEREEIYDESILKKAPCLDKLLKVLSYKEIEALWFEYEEEHISSESVEEVTDDEEDTPPTPVRKKKKLKEPEEEPEEEDSDERPRRRKKKQIEEEPEEEEPEEEEPEEEEPEEEEEEPTPKKLIRRKEKPALKRKTQEEEDDEEEEEEPTPKKKKQAEKTKCPYGHVFGEDCEEYDDCDECDIWDACREEKDKLEG